MKTVYFNFCGFSLPVELLQTPAADKLYAILPQYIAVTQWGEELYGPLSEPLIVSNPVAQVQPGTVAYSEAGRYLCVFFGQQPAWPIEPLGHIPDPHWRKLSQVTVNSVTVRI